VRIKPVVPRQRATRDVRDAVDYYLSKGSAKTALAFVDALEQAYRHLGRHPASGSPRYAHELNLPELRSWLAKGYPWLVFYAERARYVEIWRVLHGESDIPAVLLRRRRPPTLLFRPPEGDA
jgi:toxin ParE1/3/4